MNGTINERIRARLEAVGKSATRVCREAGLGLDVIRDIGRRPDILPRLDTLEALSGPLETTPEWLAFGRGLEDPHRAELPFRSVPLVSWVAASSFAEHGTVVSEGDDGWPHIDVGGLPPGQYLALRVEGDSMNRIAVHDSQIIVRLNDKQLIDRGFFVMANDEGSTFKRFRNQDGPPRLEPYSTNPNHNTIFPGGEVRVIGRVMRVISDLYRPSVIKAAT